MIARKKVVQKKVEAVRDLIKCHPLSPELATELFASKRNLGFLILGRSYRVVKKRVG